ncbi:oxidoreductase [Streptomyces sp. NPDC048737]|uniref:oxidoreductase n=1 Tax=unclassified Streptomyces TaxID=2593676 RepID=UPI00341DFDB6
METPFRDGYGSLPPGRLLTVDQTADSVVRAIRRPGQHRRQGVDVRPLGQPD